MKNRLLRHEGELLLGLIRGLALVLALSLFIFFSEVRPFLIPDYILVSMAVIYTILRIFYPSYSRRKRLFTVVLFVLDIGFCCFLPFVSGGLHSPFILFPLTSVLSVALYFRQKYSYLVATFVSCAVIGSEATARLVLSGGTFLPIQIYVTLLGMYVIIAYLIAWLPYVSNLNLSATIKERTILEERHRLSRELHDGLAQRLGSLILKTGLLRDAIDGNDKTEAVAQTDNLKREIQDAYSEVRQIIDQLRVRVPEDPRLFPTLAQFTQEFAISSGINCQLYMADGVSDLNPLATVELLRVVQEALNNVKKHAEAKLIEVKLESTTEFVRVLIRDDGKGFTPGNISGHHGLSVMRERVEGIGGSFQITSSPGRGTVIELTLPASSGHVRRIDG